MVNVRRGVASTIGLAGILAASVSMTPAVAQDTSPISGTVTLWYLEDPEFTFLPALKAEFEAAYPGTTVEMTEIPEDGFVTKVDTSILAGQPPDVAFVYEPRWMKAGAVLPLDDTIAAAGLDLSTLNATAMSECVLDGVTYCLGSLGGSVVLLYSKTLFDEAGVGYPSATEAMTVDEYAALARQLAKPSDDPAANVYGATAEVPFWWSSRTTTFSEDGRTIEGHVNDADTVHMYDVLATLARDGIAPGPAQSELAGASDMLGAGDVYMGVTDMEFGAGMMEAAGYEWGAAPPPIEVAGATPWAFVGTDKYGAFAQGANPEAAKVLVAFIGSEGSRIRAEVSDDPPLDSRYLAQWAGDNAGRQQVAEVMTAFTSPTPLIPGFWDVTAPLGDLYTLMINGEGTPQELLDEDAPAMQEALDRAWETWDAIE